MGLREESVLASHTSEKIWVFALLSEIIGVNKVLTLGLLLVFLGMIVIVMGTLLLVFKASKGEAHVEGGGIVFIGPIPIVWGTSKNITQAMLILALAVSILLLILYVFMGRGTPKTPMG